MVTRDIPYPTTDRFLDVMNFSLFAKSTKFSEIHLGKTLFVHHFLKTNAMCLKAGVE